MRHKNGICSSHVQNKHNCTIFQSNVKVLWTSFFLMLTLFQPFLASFAPFPQTYFTHTINFCKIWTWVIFVMYDFLYAFFTWAFGIRFIFTLVSISLCVILLGRERERERIWWQCACKCACACVNVRRAWERYKYTPKEVLVGKVVEDYLRQTIFHKFLTFILPSFQRGWRVDKLLERIIIKSTARADHLNVSQSDSLCFTFPD